MDLLKQAVSAYTPPTTAIIHKTHANVLSRNDISLPVYVVQYDHLLPILEVSLMSGIFPYTVPNGAAVNVRMRKPDGKCVYNPALGINTDRHTVYISMTTQMTAAAGDTHMVIEIVHSNSIAATAVIPLHVERNPISDAAIESSDEYKTLWELIQEAQKSADNVSNSAKAAKASETAAKNSENAAASSATAAANSASSALANKNAAENAKNAAIAAQQAAETSKFAAKDSEISAGKSETNASLYAERAEKAAVAAKDSEIAAEESEDEAHVSKELAGVSETNASNYARLTQLLYEALLGLTPSQSGSFTGYEAIDPILDWDRKPILDSDDLFVTARTILDGDTAYVAGYEVTDFALDMASEQILDSEEKPIGTRKLLADISDVIQLRRAISRLETLLMDILIKSDFVRKYAVFDNNYNGGKA